MHIQILQAVDIQVRFHAQCRYHFCINCCCPPTNPSRNDVVISVKPNIFLQPFLQAEIAFLCVVVVACGRRRPQANTGSGSRRPSVAIWKINVTEMQKCFCACGRRGPLPVLACGRRRPTFLCLCAVGINWFRWLPIHQSIFKRAPLRAPF